MTSSFSLLPAALLLTAVAVPGLAQARKLGAPELQEQKQLNGVPRDYGALVTEVFAPITDQLKLTKEQQFQIVAIITGTEVSAEPLISELDQVDQQLAAATLTDAPDEDEVDRLSALEASLLTQMIAMKARAKTSIYQILTASQKVLVANKLLGKRPIEGNLGAIGVF
ncbi:MAG: hypothetical protein JWM21_2088 [Acidobacteria bacterium]|nr:hypothetical protein [Acidobacteriota bacterium]